MELAEISDAEASSIMETTSAPETGMGLLPLCPLEAEGRFYGEYAGLLNPCLTVREVAKQFARELTRIGHAPEPWQRDETATNAFLFGAALLTAADDYLRGPVFQLPRLAGFIPGTRLALKAFARTREWLRARRVRQTAAWRERFLAAFVPFLGRHVVATHMGTAPPINFEGLEQLPAELLETYTQIPSAFRKLDLSPVDVLTLGREFIARFPDRGQPVLAVGLRTAGCYFAPLFRALLESEGFEKVGLATFRPYMGMGNRERRTLKEFADAGYRVALLDDPPVSGETFAHAADMLRRVGFPIEHIVAVFPIQASPRNGRPVPTAILAGLETVMLGPECWHKRRLLELPAMERRLGEYFRRRGYSAARIVAASAAADRFNRQLDATVEEERRTRLKRVFEVRLESADGAAETRFVLAKSVGSGYLSYHAFLAGSRLSEFTPPLLGLRDGLLFTEWLPGQGQAALAATDRERWVERIASYTAARVRSLPLPTAGTRRQALNNFNDGLGVLDKALSKAYGHSALARLMRGRVRGRLAGEVCPAPTLIDGKMRPAEWVGDGLLLKADFEHHGMGKNELNVVDPAYDLAEALLQFAMSPEEEGRLLARYREESGDALAPERLFLNKLLAGLWTMAGAMRNLRDPRLALRQEEFHREYVRAWDFLTVHAARHCGPLCRPQRPASWASPLVVLDVDGVIDRRVFGFPCTTWAGIEAISLLHAHGFPVALNTARSVAEVKEYCAAYGCVGGVAEYGAYVWDAVRQRGRALISAEVRQQLDAAKRALTGLPGVFVNDGYEFSIKANTYEEGLPVPLPTPLVRRFLADHDLDRLALHQTSIDSTIVAADLNKGTGLTALVEWAGLPEASTYVVGDSEPDLAMFRTAERCFAPGHISCARLARVQGCQIAPQPFQRGLLHIARSLAHADGRRCERCAAGDVSEGRGDLFFDLLRTADEKRSRLFWRALFHPSAFEMLRR